MLNTVPLPSNLEVVYGDIELQPQRQNHPDPDIRRQSRQERQINIMENYIFHFNEAFSDTSSELYNEPHLQSGIDSEDIQYVNDLVVINSNL